MNLLIWRKNHALFSRYLDIYVFVKFADFKICDVTIGIATKWKLQLCIFLLNSKYLIICIQGYMNAEPDKYFRLVSVFLSDGHIQKRVCLTFKLYADYGYLYFSKNKCHFQWMFYHAEVWIHNKQEASHNLPLHKSSTITFTKRLSSSYLEEDSQNLSYKIRNLQKLNLHVN